MHRRIERRPINVTLDGADLDDTTKTTKTRSIVTKLEKREAEQFRNHILLKTPAKVNFEDTIQMLKEAKPLTRLRYELLSVKFDGYDRKEYTGLVKSRFSAAQWNKMTEDQAQRLLWIIGFYSNEHFGTQPKHHIVGTGRSSCTRRHNLFKTTSPSQQWTSSIVKTGATIIFKHFIITSMSKMLPHAWQDIWPGNVNRNSSPIERNLYCSRFRCKTQPDLHYRANQWKANQNAAGYRGHTAQCQRLETFEQAKPKSSPSSDNLRPTTNAQIKVRGKLNCKFVLNSVHGLSINDAQERQ
uniref:Uncharacterized protein n=1 Tax=Caenorhabditis japonica TaxID=281687 RepID=A0A8R1DLK4_CAEJA